MRIQYQLTSKDYLEGTTGHRLNTRLILLIFGLIPVLIFVPQILRPQPLLKGIATAPARPSSGLFDLAAAALPWIAILVSIWILVLRQVRRVGTPAWKRKWRPHLLRRLPFWTILFAAIALDCVFAGWAVVAKNNAAAALGPLVDPTWSATSDTLVALIPWLTITVFIAAALRFSDRSSLRAWNSQRHLHRPWSLEVNEQGMAFAEPLSAHQYSWAYFPGWTESPNLFLVYQSAIQIVMIPKRAFETDADRDAFRTRLDQHISSQTNAFPVLPLAQVAATAQPVGSAS